MTRGSLWQFVLIPDEVAANWLGETGDWAIRDRVPILAGAALIHACAWVLGWPIVRALFGAPARLGRLEATLLADGLGLSLLSLWTLCLGLVGALRSPWLIFVPSTIASVVAAAHWYFQGRKQASITLSITHDATCDWLSPRWLWLAAPFALLVMLGGMLPPIEFDVREYHLQAPKEFYQLGRIEFLPHNVYANMPLGAEMWALAAMVVEQDWWRGALAGKTLIATLLPITALALYCAGARLGSRTAGIVAALIYVSFPWLLQVSMLGLIDGVVAHYVALVILALANSWPKTESRRASFTWSILAGIFAGAAAACKYPALLLVVAPVVVWIAWRYRTPKRWLSMQHGGAAMLAATTMFGPWLAKNWYFTGNPTYPLLYFIFGGATRTAERASQWNAAHRPHGFSPLQLMSDAERVLFTSPWLSPLLWPLVGITVVILWRNRQNDRDNSSVLALSRDKWLALAGFVAFIFACWWLFTHRIDRFWLPAAPPLALLAGYGAARIADENLRRGVMALLCIGLVWSLIVVASPLIAYNPYFAPLEELRASPVRVDPWILELNRRGGKVLSVGEAAVFDFEQPVLYNTTFDPSWLERYHVGDPGATTEETLVGFDKLVAEHDLKYVYVDWDEIARYRSPGNYGFDGRVTPELFELLVTQGRLYTPLKEVSSSRGEVYPVQR